MAWFWRLIFVLFYINDGSVYHLLRGKDGQIIESTSVKQVDKKIQHLTNTKIAELKKVYKDNHNGPHSVDDLDDLFDNYQLFDWLKHIATADRYYLLRGIRTKKDGEKNLVLHTTDDKFFIGEIQEHLEFYTVLEHIPPKKRITDTMFSSDFKDQIFFILQESGNVKYAKIQNANTQNPNVYRLYDNINNDKSIPIGHLITEQMLYLHQQIRRFGENNVPLQVFKLHKHESHDDESRWILLRPIGDRHRIIYISPPKISIDTVRMRYSNTIRNFWSDTWNKDRRVIFESVNDKYVYNQIDHISNEILIKHYLNGKYDGIVLIAHDLSQYYTNTKYLFVHQNNFRFNWRPSYKSIWYSQSQANDPLIEKIPTNLLGYPFKFGVDDTRITWTVDDSYKPYPYDSKHDKRLHKLTTVHNGVTKTLYIYQSEHWERDVTKNIQQHLGHIEKEGGIDVFFVESDIERWIKKQKKFIREIKSHTSDDVIIKKKLKQKMNEQDMLMTALEAITAKKPVFFSDYISGRFRPWLLEAIQYDHSTDITDVGFYLHMRMGWRNVIISYAVHSVLKTMRKANVFFLVIGGGHYDGEIGKEWKTIKHSLHTMLTDGDTALNPFKAIHGKNKYKLIGFDCSVISIPEKAT